MTGRRPEPALRARLRRHASGVLAFVASLLLAGPVRAELRVEISSAREQVGIGEQFTVTVEVSHGGVGSIPEPRLPGIDGIRQISSYKSQNFSYVNGRMTASVALQYVLVADEEGTFTLGPVTAEKGDERVTSNSVEVEVVPAGSTATMPRRLGEEDVPAESGKDLVVVGKVDNPNPFVNEQITYTFTFLRRVRVLEGSRYTHPKTTGFWTEELDTTEPTEVTVDGKRYIAERVRTALFPTGDGEYVIGPGTLNVTVEDRRSRRRRDPFDLFGRDPFSLLRNGRDVVLQTDPIRIDVRPLPTEGKPVDFSGAVGTFGLQGSVDRTSVGAGEPVTFTILLAGRGNVKVVPAPDLSILEDFKVYESESSESSQAKGGVITGMKEWEFVLVPTTGGDLTIPPVRLTAFDPNKEKYVALSTQPIAVHVKATDLDEAIARGDDVGLTKERVRLRQRDIRYVKPAPARLRSTGGSSPITRPGMLLAHFVPVLALAGTTMFRRHRDKLKSDVRYARSRAAAKVAARRLSAASSALTSKDLEKFYAELSIGLRGYVADRLHLAAANLEEDAVRRGYAERDVAGEDVDELFELLETCNSARFSPLGSDPVHGAEVLERAKRWIGRVDRR